MSIAGLIRTQRSRLPLYLSSLRNMFFGALGMPSLVLSPAQKQVATTAYAAFFIRFGWLHPHCCGLLAMALGESSLQPGVIGDHGHSFGLWQIQAVAAVLKDTGIDLAHNASVEDQCTAVDYLLRHSEHVAGAALKNASTPTEAATVLVNLFERPKDKASAIAKRVPYALFFDQMFGASK